MKRLPASAHAITGAHQLCEKRPLHSATWGKSAPSACLHHFGDRGSGSVEPNYPSKSSTSSTRWAISDSFKCLFIAMLRSF